MTPPHNPPLLLYPVQNHRIQAFLLNGREMKCENRGICAVEATMVHSDIYQSGSGQQPGGLHAAQDPGRESVIAHVQAPC